MSEVQHAKPEEFVIGTNGARFDLNEARVEDLAENILSEGQVLQPVGVVKEEDKLRLLFGFHRVAAVAKLNAKGTGLTVPYVVLERADALAQLKTQISENNQRQELSPMDKAMAIRELLTQGVNRGEVRRIFSVPGGRKGSVLSPMSNAMLNIHLRFLDLPKGIQEKIHSGRLTWAAAYALGRVTPDKRADVLARAERESDEQTAVEEKDEERYLKAETKLAEVEESAQQASTKLERAQQAIVDAQQLLADRSAAYKEVQQEVGDAVVKKGSTEKDKKLAAEKLKAAEADLKGAEKAVKDAKNEVVKLTTVRNKATEKAEEVKAALEAQRKALKNKPKGVVGPKAVVEAAKAEGARTGAVPLNLQEIRELLKEGRNQSEYPKVAAAFKYLTACVDGVTIPKECIGNIALLTGERKVVAAVAPPKEGKAKK